LGLKAAELRHVDNQNCVTKEIACVKYNLTHIVTFGSQDNTIWWADPDL